LSTSLSLIGFENLHKYNHELAWQGAELMSSMWNTSFVVPKDMTGTMSNVGLPTNDGNAVSYLYSVLKSKYNMNIRFGSVVDINQTTIWYIRLSGQIYLEYNDFVKLAHLVPKIIAEYIPSSK